jgi:hypothetical protein
MLPFSLRSVAPPPKSKILAAVFENAANAEQAGTAQAEGLSFGAWINELLSPFIKPSLQPVVSVVLLLLLVEPAGTPG